MPQLCRHFVTFIGPMPPHKIALGAYTFEMREVPDWCIDNAVEIAGSLFLTENARPYAFYFTTRGRDRSELDSREINRSPNYYLGGRLMTLDAVERTAVADPLLDSSADPSLKPVAANMRQTKTDTVIVNDNSWRFVGAFNSETDILLDVKLPALPLANPTTEN